VRLFLAIDLDDAARAAIVAEQTRIAGALPRPARPRFVTPEQLHLTLVFLGDVDEALAARVDAVLAPALPRTAFDAVFDGIGMFPPRGAPRVLWIGVTDGARELIAVQQDVAHRMTHLGIALEARSFSPHLTIARWRDARTSDRAAVDALPQARLGVRVRIDHVTLYRSTLSSAGATYRPLARANLLS